MFCAANRHHPRIHLLSVPKWILCKRFLSMSLHAVTGLRSNTPTLGHRRRDPVQVRGLDHLPVPRSRQRVYTGHPRPREKRAEPLHLSEQATTFHWSSDRGMRAVSSEMGCDARPNDPCVRWSSNVNREVFGSPKQVNIMSVSSPVMHSETPTVGSSAVVV